MRSLQWLGLLLGANHLATASPAQNQESSSNPNHNTTISYHQFGHLPNPASSNAATISPFTFTVPEANLTAAATLLRNAPVVQPTWENSSPDHGISRDWLLDARDFWLNEFDWRAHEARLNGFPNFMAKVKVDDDEEEAMDVHFVGLFSQREDAVPLVLLHGWPGSIFEFLPMLTLLAEKYTPETLPYHVVVPSLPGYGLSAGPPLDRNFLGDDAVRVLNQLMRDLGFGERGYIAQGGDVGAGLVTYMSANVEECKAFHLNRLATVGFGNAIPTNLTDLSLTPAELEHARLALDFQVNGTSYFNEHGQRGSTISAALQSSPLALLAWIGEKLIQWPDPTTALDTDTIILLVSFYWFTETQARSTWAYRWVSEGDGFGHVSQTKPLGYSYFPHEVTGFVPESQSDLFRLLDFVGRPFPRVRTARGSAC